MFQKSKNILVLIGLFIASRLLLYAIGVRFNITPLTWYFQYLDPLDLKTNFFQSLIYLHSQPPGFNFFIGAILNAAPNFELIVFHIVYGVMGLIITVVLFTLLTRFNLSIRVALFFSIFFAISPPVILYENWLFYTYPVMFFLLLSAFFLYQYIKKQRWYYIFLFFLNCALIVITRTLFQPIWFILIFIGLIITMKHNVKKIILSGLVPLLIIAGVYCKNYIIFKNTSLSSWLGMNLIKMTFTIPTEKIEPLIEKGEISNIAIIKPFRDPKAYQIYAPFDTVTGIPVLDKKYKSTGAVNFNHIGYITVSRKYFAAATHLIKKFPKYYGLSIIKAFYTYLRPSSSFQKCSNTEKIALWKHFYEEYFCGNILKKIWSTSYTNRFNQIRTIHLNFLYIFIPILYIWGIMLMIKGKKLLNFTKNQSIMLNYFMLNVIYVTLIGNFIETGENMRFRLLCVPFIYILIALLFKYITPRKT